MIPWRDSASSSVLTRGVEMERGGGDDVICEDKGTR